MLISTEQSGANGTSSSRCAIPGRALIRKHIERVFDAFYTTKSSGVGMGLSICRSIIEAHGGRLWADANEPRGAAISVHLAQRGRELMNSLQAAHQNGEPHEDTA